jgi:hypothetical protein
VISKPWLGKGLSHGEATTKPTKNTKGISRPSATIAELFFEVKLTSRLEDVIARAVPPKMQYFVTFVSFVVASSRIGRYRC